ncbi:YjzD family protein [Oenococcus sp.]|uniref:YjzD family protein n=1 Tax=Oenococcus sp. TaxID=1979414 RepID=UPI0039E9DDFE
MKYIAVGIWSVILGNVLGFIVGELSKQAYIPWKISIIFLVIGEAAAFLITTISQSADNSKKNTDQ